jgi:hypothetical protein
MAIINGRGRVGARPSSGGGAPSYDADALAFFTANSTLTDTAQKNAINQFVLDLKANSLWSIGKYMYLGFLGDSTRVKYNLFNPSSNILTLSSGWSFDGQGMKGNGASTYAQTGFIPSVSASLNSKSLFIYSQTDISELSADMGCFDNTSGDMFLPKVGTTLYFGLSRGQWQQIANNGTTKGLQLISRTSSTSSKGYNKTSLLGTDTQVSISNPSNQDYLGCFVNISSPQWHSTRKISIYGRMNGLDATQEANLNTCINTMLTTLSIPTY